jgi:hypothetical protein
MTAAVGAEGALTVENSDYISLVQTAAYAQDPRASVGGPGPEEVGAPFIVAGKRPSGRDARAVRVGCRPQARALDESGTVLFIIGAIAALAPSVEAV